MSATTCRWRMQRSTRRSRRVGGRSWWAGPGSTCGPRWRSSRWSRRRRKSRTRSFGRRRRGTQRAIFGLDMDREKLYERIDARTEAIVAAGAREEVVQGRRDRAFADRPQGLRLRRSARRRHRADAEALPQLRPPPAHLDAQDPQPPLDRPRRPDRRRDRSAKSPLNWPRIPDVLRHWAHNAATRSIADLPGPEAPAADRQRPSGAARTGCTRPPRPGPSDYGPAVPLRPRPAADRGDRRRPTSINAALRDRPDGFRRWREILEITEEARPGRGLRGRGRRLAADAPAGRHGAEQQPPAALLRGRHHLHRARCIAASSRPPTRATVVRDRRRRCRPSPSTSPPRSPSATT